MELLPALHRSWALMKQRLFAPFDVGKWLVLGFSAWLSGLFDGGGAGVSNLQIPSANAGAVDLGGTSNEFEEVVAEAWGWMVGAGMVIGAILLVVAAVVVVLLWVSSRAKFIYLDNVVHDRAAMVEPWKRSRELGNSLFVFRLSLLILGVLLVIAAIGAVVAASVGLPDGFEIAVGPMLVFAGLGLTSLVVMMAYMMFFLNAFVVPIMYRSNLHVLDAWRRFLPLLRQNLGGLLLLGVLVALLHFGVAIAILTVGCMTCCLGLILMIIPYVGTVVLLPLLVTYRLYTLVLLGELDPSLRLLPESATAPE